MGNSFFNEYPYTDFHELNLSWVIRELRKFATTLDQFVTINALKYADPIQWSITSQYEKNTIVLDPASGTAYISVQPVPAGVLITDTNYWTEVFDLEQFVTRANNNFTLRVEPQTTLNATFATNTGEWIVWNNILYEALTNIVPGDQYVIGGNIKRITVEEYVNILKTIINAVSANIGNLANLSTTDKSNLVNAINEVLTTLSSITGDLSDLDTTDKSNLVNAINEINSRAQVNDYKHFINVTSIGVAGDGITDDTAAIQNAINNHDCLYFPAGKYLISDTIEITRSVQIAGAGTLATFFIRASGFNGTMIDIDNSISCEISSIRIANGGELYDVYDSTNRAISIIDATSGNYKFDEIWIDSGVIGFYIENSSNIRIVNSTIFQESAYSNNGYMTEYGMQFFGHCTGIWIDNCFISGQDASSPHFMHFGMLIQGADGIYVTNTGITSKIGVFFTNQYAYVDDVYFTNCVLDNCTQSFIGSESSGSNNVFNNIMFDNCHMDTVGNITGDPGVVVDYRIMNFKLSNSFIGGCSGSGIKLLGGSTYNNKSNHDHSITNCYIVGVNQANLAGQVGIAGQANGCTINGNTITNSGIRDGHAKYAITLEADNILVSGNKLDTMETDYIYEQGGLTNVLKAANLPASVNT